MKNGHTHNSKQSFKCRDGARQFVVSPRHQPISAETRKLIDKLLLERISLAGICRTTGVSPKNETEASGFIHEEEVVIGSGFNRLQYLFT